jgi:hypothetical protein
MGRSRLLPLGLILASLAACGGEDDVLAAMDLDAIYAGGGGSGRYKMTGGAPGKIVGRVRFEGTPSPRKLLDLTTQDGFCVKGHAPQGLFSENLLVGENGALANVVVYVKEGVAGGKWPVPTEPVVLDQVKCQYIPHVAILRAGQPLVVKSSDNTTHNVHMAKNAPNDEVNASMVRPGSLSPMTFRKPEMARRVWCDVHSWMESWVAIVPHPFHALTGADGAFTIENVPPGVFQLSAWQEDLGERPMDVTVPPGGTVEVEFVFQQ